MAHRQYNNNENAKLRQNEHAGIQREACAAAEANGDYGRRALRGEMIVAQGVATAAKCLGLTGNIVQNNQRREKIPQQC